MTTPVPPGSTASTFVARPGASRTLASWVTRAMPRTTSDRLREHADPIHHLGARVGDRAGAVARRFDVEGGRQIADFGLANRLEEMRGLRVGIDVVMIEVAAGSLAKPNTGRMRIRFCVLTVTSRPTMACRPIPADCVMEGVMPTIVYLVHGMGCGTADGKPQPGGKDWANEATTAFSWLCSSFKLPAPSVVSPSDTKPPKNPLGAGDDNAIWVVPLSYYSIFDEFRASSKDRASLVKGVTSVLSDADITRLTSQNFAWQNCLDVLLWWADDAQTNNRTTALLANGITAVNELAMTIPGATTRRIILSHSLGTAAVTATLLDLATKQVWKDSTGFEAWFTLANVAPFLLEQDEVYSPSLVPDGDESLIHPHMYNAHNECDPVPWLLFSHAFSPNCAGKTETDWKNAQALGFFEDVQTLDVAAPAGFVPDITGVHGFSNYMLAPDIALRLATHVRGAGFTAQELAAIDYEAHWKSLPHLQCAKSATAFTELRTAVANYKTSGPAVASSNPKVDWIGRLIDGVELLTAFQTKC